MKNLWKKTRKIWLLHPSVFRQEYLEIMDFKNENLSKDLNKSSNPDKDFEISKSKFFILLLNLKFYKFFNKIDNLLVNF